MKLLGLCALSILPIHLFAQTPYSISAKVLDDQNAPVEFGNVLLINSKDSSLIKGELISEGEFLMNKVNVDEALLHIKVIGFEEQYLPIKRPEGTELKLDDIALKNSDLTDVTVKAFKPAFKREGDKVVVDVEGSGLAESGTVIDLLRKSPGVLVTGEYNVQIFGKGTPRIYVDGQLLTSQNLLLSISSEDVKEIQIIKNPGAEYDAEGQGGVINIITKVNTLQGVNGSVSASTAHGRDWFHSANTRISYRKNKFNTFFIANTFFGTRGNSNEYFRSIFDPAGTIYFDNELDNIRDINYNSNFRLGADYQINSKHKVSLQWKTIYDNVTTKTSNANYIYDDYNTLSLLETKTDNSYLMRNNVASLNYKFKDDSTKNTLVFNTDYSVYSSEDLGSIVENITTNSTVENDKQSIGANKIRLFSAKLDHKKTFSEVFTLSSGLKHYESSNNSSALFQQLQGGEWEEDSALTNGYNFREGVSALYTEATINKNKFSGRFGLRAERTQTQGTSALASGFVVDTSYFNLFPTAFLGYELGKDLDLGFNYTTRFRRPAFQDLNPFIEYIDSVSAFIGNPFLQPEYSHNLSLSLTYMEYASIEFGYTRTNNEVLFIAEKTPQNAFYVQDQNINFGEIYNFDITLPYQTKSWTTYNGFGYSMTRYNFNDNGVETDLKLPSFYFYLYNELNLPADISLSGTFWYSGRGLEGVFLYEPLYGLNATVTKKLFKKKVTLSFSANDILRSNIQQGYTNLEGFEIQYRFIYDTNFYRLGIRYNFGKLKATDYSDKSGNGEEMGRIKND